MVVHVIGGFTFQESQECQTVGHFRAKVRLMHVKSNYVYMNSRSSSYYLHL